MSGARCPKCNRYNALIAQQVPLDGGWAWGQRCRDCDHIVYAARRGDRRFESGFKIVVEIAGPDIVIRGIGDEVIELSARGLSQGSLREFAEYAEKLIGDGVVALFDHIRQG